VYSANNKVGGDYYAQQKKYVAGEIEPKTSTLVPCWKVPLYQSNYKIQVI
jgi:hypothetical protein